MGTSFSALRRLFARADDPYAGADIELARRFAGVTWPAAILIAYVLVPFFPPTHAFGPAGWYACAAGALVTLAGYAYLRGHPERVTYNFFYVAGWCSLAQLALLQWLAGGRIAPYHEFLLFQIIATGLMHPPRRFALFIAAVMAAGFAPAFYAPATARVGEIATEQVLWVGLGVVLLLLMRNIRAQRVSLAQAGAEARQEARVDALTGLGNRRAFDERLELELESAGADGTRVSLLVADLNYFKQINDEYGHVAGDHCLRQAANALRAAVRAADACYRWGGDEFAVILSDAASGDAAALAARIEASVAQLCQGPNGRPLSLACGYAEIDGEATAAEALTKADAVLLSLKRGGALARSAEPADAAR